MKKKQNIHRLSLLLVGCLGCIVIFFSNACTKELPVIPIDTNFSLIDHNGKAFKTSDLHGKITLLYFGFTRCPDFCPNTLNRLEKVASIMSFRSNYLQVALVSVDPKHDTPEILSKYIAPYKMNLVGLWANENELKTISKNFGAGITPARYGSEHGTEHGTGHREGHRAQRVDQDKDHFIAHSDYVFLLDKKARLRYIFRQGDLAPKIANTLRRLGL